MYDKKFYTLLDYVFADEGGFSNHKNDRGGRTNFGISQIAMDEYTRKRNLPHKDVKYITKDEAAKIYYEDYYLKSGADKQEDIRDALIFLIQQYNMVMLLPEVCSKQRITIFTQCLKIEEKHIIKEL